MHAVIKTFFSVEVRGIILMARGVWHILFCKLKFSKGEAGPEFPFRFSYGDKIGHYGIGMNQKNKKNCSELWMTYTAMWESPNNNNNRLFFWDNVPGVGDFFDMKWCSVFLATKGEMITDWILNDLETEENSDIHICLD